MSAALVAVVRIPYVMKARPGAIVHHHVTWPDLFGLIAAVSILGALFVFARRQQAGVARTARRPATARATVRIAVARLGAAAASLLAP